MAQRDRAQEKGLHLGNDSPPYSLRSRPFWSLSGTRTIDDQRSGLGRSMATKQRESFAMRGEAWQDGCRHELRLARARSAGMSVTQRDWLDHDARTSQRCHL